MLKKKKGTKKKKSVPTRKDLINIYLDEDSKVTYGFNENESDTIIDNSTFILGLLSEAEREVLDLKYKQEDEEDEEEDDEDEEEEEDEEDE